MSSGKKFYGDGSFNDFCYIYEPIIRKHLPNTSDATIEKALLQMFSHVPSLMARITVEG